MEYFFIYYYMPSSSPFTIVFCYFFSKKQFLSDDRLRERVNEIVCACVHCNAYQAIYQMETTHNCASIFETRENSHFLMNEKKDSKLDAMFFLSPTNNPLDSRFFLQNNHYALMTYFRPLLYIFLFYFVVFNAVNCFESKNIKLMVELQALH